MMAMALAGIKTFPPAGITCAVSNLSAELPPATAHRTGMIAKVELAKSDAITFEKVYSAIREHEPRGMENPDGLHPDGVSWGRSGATCMAKDRLIEEWERGERVGAIPPAEYDLADPATNELIGREYLRLGLRKRGHLWGAVEFYHGDKPGARATKGRHTYVETIWGLMK
jgi:hypothetical protein